MGGRQEHHRVPAVQENFLCGKKKGVFGWVWVSVGVCEMGGRGAAVKMSRV